MDGVRGILSDRRFLLLLLCYFIFQMLRRIVLAPGALEIDEAEQLVLAQKWSWGYGSQPPLYTWVQILFFKVFGISVFSLALFKNILLFLLFLFIYLTGRLVIRSGYAAQACAISLLFFPEISWQSQIDRTHSILALTFVCATLYWFLKIVEERRTLYYCLLGLSAGICLLAKYNTGFFLIALVAAAASLPVYRQVLRDRRILLSLGILLAVFLPNALWMLNNPQLALLSAFKFQIEKSSSLVNFRGIGRMFGALLSVLAPMVLLHGLVLGWYRKEPQTLPPNPHLRLLWRISVAVLVLFAVAVLFSGATSVRERWLLPALVFAPIVSLGTFADRLNPVRLKWFYALGLLMMVGVTVGHTGRVVFSEKMKQTDRLNFPYSSLAPQLKAPLGGVPVVITDGLVTAGDLRLNLPGRIYTPDLLAVLIAPETESFALVWDASKREAPPERLLRYLQQAGVEFLPADVRYVSAPLSYHTTSIMRLGYIHLRKFTQGWPFPVRMHKTVKEPAAAAL